MTCGGVLADQQQQQPAANEQNQQTEFFVPVVQIPTSTINRSAVTPASAVTNETAGPSPPVPDSGQQQLNPNGSGSGSAHVILSVASAYQRGQTVETRLPDRIFPAALGHPSAAADHPSAAAGHPPAAPGHPSAAAGYQHDVSLLVHRAEKTSRINFKMSVQGRGGNSRATELRDYADTLPKLAGAGKSAAAGKASVGATGQPNQTVNHTAALQPPVTKARAEGSPAAAAAGHKPTTQPVTRASLRFQELKSNKEAKTASSSASVSAKPAANLTGSPASNVPDKLASNVTSSPVANVPAKPASNGTGSPADSSLSAKSTSDVTGRAAASEPAKQALNSTSSPAPSLPVKPAGSLPGHAGPSNVSLAQNASSNSSTAGAVPGNSSSAHTETASVSPVIQTANQSVTGNKSDETDSSAKPSGKDKNDTLTGES